MKNNAKNLRIILKRYFKIFIKALFYLMMDIIWLISGLVPKDKNLWVFGSWFGNKFADNSKYLFLYVRKYHPEIRSVWLSRNPKVVSEVREVDCEAYTAYSIKGFFLSMRAGAIVVSTGLSDMNRFAISKSKKVHLWHGSPLKKIGYDDKIFSSPVNYSALKSFMVTIWHKLFPFTEDKYDMVVVASALTRDIFSSAFRIPKDNVVITGYPRNDALLSNITIPNVLSDIKDQRDYEHLIFYLPTFRGQIGSEFDLFTDYGFDVNKIEKSSEEINALFLIKTHPFNCIRDKELLAKVHYSRRIKIVNDSDFDDDIYPILRKTDVLITDYSSVYFDFLLLNRPIIFSPFDIKSYIQRDRELYYNYNDVTPGPKAKNWNEVLEYIKEAIKYPQKYESERKRICKLFNAYNDANSSERVYKAIKEILNNESKS